MVRVLIQDKGTNLNLSDEYRKTLLTSTAWKYNKEIVALLQEPEKLMCKTSDEKGHTVL